MSKARFLDRRTDRLGRARTIPNGDRRLPLEIGEENLRSYREARVNELRLQYASGQYYVPAAEISAALIEKHLKR